MSVSHRSFRQHFRRGGKDMPGFSRGFRCCGTHSQRRTSDPPIILFRLYPKENQSIKKGRLSVARISIYTSSETSSQGLMKRYGAIFIPLNQAL
jgi:hypothetical protein